MHATTMTIATTMNQVGRSRMVRPADVARLPESDAIKRIYPAAGGSDDQAEEPPSSAARTPEH